MAPSPEYQERVELDGFTRFIHLGLTVFGLLALITGFFAGDYKHPHHAGFSFHKWFGIGLATFLALRLWHGFTGPQEARFREWVPYTRERLLFILKDIMTLLKSQLPERPPRQGLSGLVQTFGLAAFAWMGATGALMFILMTPGVKARGFLRLIKEMHEAGWWLALVFLCIHGGAVIIHALAGQDLWRPMFFLPRRSK
ncbi:MAG: cytochrome b/b6 domain-containing protein [Deltaproteobacteria bacterium]|nr:cytochrome b/b6 domain-containing protein [Deltaproteobacteria bacterium]